MRLRTIALTATGAAAASIVGGLASKPNIDTWYAKLDKPGYVPPNAVFPVAWTSLYGNIATTSAKVIDTLRDEGRTAEADAYGRALAANYLLNGAWSWVFFSWHRLPAAAAAAALLTASSVDLTRRAAAVDPKFGAALALYPAWTAFATVMSADIARRNRG
ncbi:TspO/MBR family protein [Mycolicibacterium brumae]|uniref:Tryptophan-rich sensory protein n=1 Tax=Mycolicibacterium brumae TaxID=85968 RepID=A0A2G5PCP6_9MYCO|nr:TspO/MBR family protein [Mycolicibacterium brumae]MCV7191399.1 tryptophan-rich sensory protein [Mycolicibacterium brumae]PIB75783.1 tryptophan-rich sensory protein [Mycolicibacterium brumae]RWA16111.1 hypothetical protein MBRU_08355 [Mycolicibacterium brumae DSM 44177]UWW09493.1 tryptophan-rich sensory protein [Mycolicibacterium brumae]